MTGPTNLGQIADVLGQGVEVVDGIPNVLFRAADFYLTPITGKDSLALQPITADHLDPDSMASQGLTLIPSPGGTGTYALAVNPTPPLVMVPLGPAPGPGLNPPMAVGVVLNAPIVLDSGGIGLDIDASLAVTGTSLGLSVDPEGGLSIAASGMGVAAKTLIPWTGVYPEEMLMTITKTSATAFTYSGLLPRYLRTVYTDSADPTPGNLQSKWNSPVLALPGGGSSTITVNVDTASHLMWAKVTPSSLTAEEFNPVIDIAAAGKDFNATAVNGASVDDAAAGVTDLWSASKITAMLGAIVGTGTWLDYVEELSAVVPAGGILGARYLNTVDHKIYEYDGAAWVGVTTAAEGQTLWCVADKAYYVYDAVVGAYKDISTAMSHEFLQNMNTATYYHLTQANHTLLTTNVEATAMHIHDTLYYTETELDAGQLDNRYYTEPELDAGQLDNRYYTEPELDAGQLDTIYFQETEHINASAGAGDAGKPIVLDAVGVIDASMIAATSIPHGGLTGLILSDDHTQYHNDARGDARYYTETALDAGQLDTRYYTEVEADARYFPSVSDLEALDNVSAAPPATDGQVLAYNTASTQWEPETLPPSGSGIGTAYITGADATAVDLIAALALPASKVVAQTYTASGINTGVTIAHYQEVWLEAAGSSLTTTIAGILTIQGDLIGLPAMSSVNMNLGTLSLTGKLDSISLSLVSAVAATLNGVVKNSAITVNANTAFGAACTFDGVDLIVSGGVTRTFELGGAGVCTLTGAITTGVNGALEFANTLLRDCSITATAFVAGAGALSITGPCNMRDTSIFVTSLSISAGVDVDALGCNFTVISTLTIGAGSSFRAKNIMVLGDMVVASGASLYADQVSAGSLVTSAASEVVLNALEISDVSTTTALANITVATLRSAVAATITIGANTNIGLANVRRANVATITTAANCIIGGLYCDTGDFDLPVAAGTPILVTNVNYCTALTAGGGSTSIINTQARAGV